MHECTERLLGQHLVNQPRGYIDTLHAFFIGNNLSAFSLGAS